MQPCPETPPLTDADLSGHLWVEEFPTGGPLRFQLSDTGVLTFGTEQRNATATDDLPVAYHRAITTIRHRLDRTALRDATDDPESVTFVGRATWNTGVDYDWATLLPFVGTDVWSSNRGTYVPPDTAATVFERLGLSTLPAIEKELPAAHTDLADYTDESRFPESAWYDGPAAGVLVRDKTGHRGLAWHRTFDPDTTTSHADQSPFNSDKPSSDTDPDQSDGVTVDTLLETYATADAIERTIDRLKEANRTPTVDVVTDRLVADIAREHYATVYHDDDPVVTLDSFRSAVAERVQRVRSGFG